MQAPGTQGTPLPPKADRSVGELLADLAQDTSTLVRQEVSLATAEMTQKASQAAKGIGFLILGGAFAFTALLMLADMGVIVLAGVMPAWLAFVIVAGAVAAIGAAFVMKGVNALKANKLMPRQTLETLKEDVQWAKKQAQGTNQPLP